MLTPHVDGESCLAKNNDYFVTQVYKVNPNKLVFKNQYLFVNEKTLANYE